LSANGHPYVPGTAKPTPVLYLDFDGTVRKGVEELGRFVNGPADVEIYPEVPPLLEAYRARGWRIVGVSNQGGVALGHVTYADAIRACLETALQCRAMAAVWVCTHHPRATELHLASCWCRKPQIGLLVRAQMGLAECYPDECHLPCLALLVGDRPEDEQCARNANIRFMHAATWRRGAHLEELIRGA
jgi:D-glycero-D-manno-heptose 1,7-bisphosphate phosphatase